MSKPDPPHITRARVRFAERYGEQKAFIPIGEEALRIAAEEFHAQPQPSSRNDKAVRQACEAKNKLD